MSNLGQRFVFDGRDVLPYLLLLGILIPATELFLLVVISNTWGVGWTFGLIICTGVLGAFLWRRQGLGAWGRIRSGLGRGESPGNALMDGAMIFFAGGLLLTPGLITDLSGFALLIPFSRNCIKRWVFHWLKSRFQLIDLSSSMTSGMPFGSSPETSASSSGAFDSADADIVEGEIVTNEGGPEEPGDPGPAFLEKE